jgi:iron complex outermembrane receptor protein
MTVQMYYDRTDHGMGLGEETRDTIDADAQHRFQLGERQEIVWGAGYRFSTDDIRGGSDFSIDDPRVGLQLFSAFVQDEITLVPDRLRLILGTKVEHNDFTGFEFQPSARLAWTFDARQTLWASVSRAVRTPSRTERGAMFYSQPSRQLPVLPFLALFPVAGNSNFQSEELVAYELGYRVQPHSRLSMDWTTFYNDYDHLRDAMPGTAEARLSPANVPYIVLPLTANNSLKGETYGTEVSATWQPKDFWRLRGGYSFLRQSLDNRNYKPSPGEADGAGSPQQQAFLWSDMDLGRHVEWGMGLRFVDRLPLLGIRAYTELDARLAWRPNPKFELAIMGRNLLDPHHREFAPNSITIPNVEVDRAVYAKVTFRF